MKTMHHYSLIILILFIRPIHAESQTIFPPDGISQKDLINYVQTKKAEHNLEFAFDIHKVLVHKVPIVQWQIIWNYPHKFEFIKCLFDVQLMQTLSSMLWQLIRNILPWNQEYKDVTSGQLITAFNMAQKPELANFFTTLVNTQQVDPAMMVLIITLSKAGYPLHVASNIGKPIFIELKQKLEAIHENIFAYFDKDAQGMEGKTIDYLVSKAEKPNPNYYIQYLDAYDPARTKLTIFVDDKLININAAIKQGFLGIHFKDAEQLYNDLMYLGIL